MWQERRCVARMPHTWPLGRIDFSQCYKRVSFIGRYYFSVEYRFYISSMRYNGAILRNTFVWGCFLDPIAVHSFVSKIQVDFRVFYNYITFFVFKDTYLAWQWTVFPPQPKSVHLNIFYETQRNTMAKWTAMYLDANSARVIFGSWTSYKVWCICINTSENVKICEYVRKTKSKRVSTYLVPDCGAIDGIRRAESNWEHQLLIMACHEIALDTAHDCIPHFRMKSGWEPISR